MRARKMTAAFPPLKSGSRDLLGLCNAPSCLPRPTPQKCRFLQKARFCTAARKWNLSTGPYLFGGRTRNSTVETKVVSQIEVPWSAIAISFSTRIFAPYEDWYSRLNTAGLCWTRVVNLSRIGGPSGGSDGNYCVVGRFWPTGAC